MDHTIRAFAHSGRDNRASIGGGMNRLTWRFSTVALNLRKITGAMLNAVVLFLRHVAQCFKQPDLDETHAADRYFVAQMTREEWEEYQRARFEEACEKEERPNNE